VKFGLFYEICVPKPWTPEKEATIVRNVVEQVRHAEAHGFDYIWLTEHHFLQEFAHCSAPEVLLGALSQVTTRMRLGHGVVLTPPKYNHPARVAERIAMLDILSNGRVELGTGRSVSPTELEGFEINAEESRDMWLEGTQAVVKLLTQEEVGFKGKYVNIPPRTVVPRCIQKPHPPMWLAGTSPDSARRAAEAGLGILFFASGVAPEQLDDKVNLYRKLVKNATPVAGFVNNQLAGFTTGLCGEDDAETKKIGSEAAHWYALRGMRYTRWPKDQPPPRTYEYTLQGMWEGEKHLLAGGPQSLIDSGGIMVGDPASCTKIVQRFQDVGVDQLIIHMQAGGIPHKKIMDSIRIFGKNVIPKFQKTAAGAKK